MPVIVPNSMPLGVTEESTVTSGDEPAISEAESSSAVPPINPPEPLVVGAILGGAK
ncbi:hypothetical protein D9M68_896000 [compost metagenome]